MSDFGKGLGALIPGGAATTTSPHPTSGHPLPHGERESIAPPLPAGEGRVRVLPPHEPNEGDVMAILHVAPSQIDPNPRQPRTIFNEEKLEELKNSIAQYGILEPLIVTEKSDGRFELIAGERRLRSANALHFPTVPVVVRHADDLEKLELSLIENIQRQDLNPIEEAEAYRELVEAFGLTQEETAKKAGKSREAISNALRILELPVDMQKAIAMGTITPAHARILLSIDNPRARQEVFQKVTGAGLTVRETQDLASPTIRRKRASMKDPAIVADEARLRESLNTKVQIEKRGQRGRVVIHFYSDEDYGDILGKIISDEKNAQN
ncbi:MAG: ParB/RepB/Spo0J family partition protein [bacterium]|nr:ParB/RepB/Spo0J family partition protein [bacterium]